MLDDVPCVVIHCNKPSKPQKVRPLKRCQTCQHTKRCKKFVDKPYDADREERYYSDEITYHCREPKGIPLFSTYSDYGGDIYSSSTYHHSISEIREMSGGVEFRLNDYPSKICARFGDGKFCCGFLGLQIDCKADLKYNGYDHNHGYASYSGRQLEMLQVHYGTTVSTLFGGICITNYNYIITLDWDGMMMYATLVIDGKRVAVSLPHSLRHF